MSKKIKDLLSGLKDRADAAASEIAVVGKTTTEKFVADANVGTIIVDGSVTKAGIYGNGDYVTVKGYAGKGSVKSAAAVELTKETEDQADVAITLSGNVNAQLAAAAKVEFTAEDKKYVPASAAPETVAVNGTMVTVIDAKVTDAFGGAVMTDTASSKKYKTDLKAVVTDAKVNVVGGTVTNVFAGGAGASSVTNGASVNISGGKVTNVYAGGAEGSTVIGDVAINIDMNSAVAAAAMNVGTIYAGGKNANVFGNVVITVTTNGAQGSTGKIGKIVGAPQGTGVVFGSRDLVLDAFQGDFAATVKGMDTVTIRDNSAVTFSKGQDKSMVNAEYIIELSEADNSNQAAVLTVKSDYKFNKLSVSVDADLITAGGSFTRALIAGNKSKFNSSTFDVNEINVKKDNGGLIADYQYELKFDTDLDKKGNAVENGKLIFTYTGATLELGVAGYINREGVANVLSSADDVVSFGATWDPMAGTAGILDKEISYNFKTMAGDDQITIDDEVLFTGKLSVGAGNDTVIINGSLAKLDLAGAGENLVVVNGMLDARNITASADSVNTFVINGVVDAFAVNNTVTHGATVKQTFFYADGSWTEDEIDSKKKLLYTEFAVIDANGKLVTTAKQPVAGPAIDVDRWIASLTQAPVTDGVADNFALYQGDNTVIINNAAGVADINLGGGKATVVIADAYDKAIDLSKAAESTIVVDGDITGATLKGSRKGASNIIIAADTTSTVAALDLVYKNAALAIEQAVTLTVADWENAAMTVEEVVIGDNAELVIDGGANAGTYIDNFSGYKNTAANLTSFGTISDSVIEFFGGELSLTDVANSAIVVSSNADVAFKTMTESTLTFDAAANLVLDGATVDAASAIVYGNDLGAVGVTFRNDVVIDGTIDLGANNTFNFDFQDASVAFNGTIITEGFVDYFGTQSSTLNFNLVESDITLGQDLTIGNLNIVNWGNVYGEGALKVTGDFGITGSEITFGADQKIDLAGANNVVFTDSDITIEDGYTLTVDAATVDGGTLTGGAIKADGTVTFQNGAVVDGTAIEGIVGASDTTFKNVEITGDATFTNGSVTGSTIVGDVTTNGADLKEVTVSGKEDENGDVVGGKITVDSDITLTDVTALNIDTNADVTFAGTNTVTENIALGGVLTFADKAKVTADTLIANGNDLFFGKEVEFGVSKIQGAVTFAGEEVELKNLLSVIDGELTINAGKFVGDVRVYGYETWLVNPYGITTADGISISGNFEADVVAEGDLTLSDTTRIERLNDEEYNKDAYGTLTFKYDSVMTVTGADYAFIEKGVFANDNLTLLGNAEANFDVTNTLTLGQAGTEEDYVIWGDEDVAAINANIKGNVEADNMVVAAAATIYGKADVDNAVAVLNDATLKITDAANIGSLTVAGFVPVDPVTGARAQAAGTATFEKLATVGAVIVGTKGAVQFADLVNKGDITVAEAGSVAIAGSTVVNGWNVWDATAKDAVITANDVTFQKLVLRGNVTVKNLDVADKTLDANLEVNGNVTINGGITMDAANNNIVTLGKDQVVTGALAYGAVTVANVLNIEGSADIKGGLSFKKNLTMNFKDAMRDTDGDGIAETAYAEFKNDITMTDAVESLTINKLAAGTATVKMGKISFGGADDKDVLTPVDYDTLTINANVNANGVTAGNGLHIKGNGTLTSDVEAAVIDADNTVTIKGNVTAKKEMTLDDNTIEGKVTVGEKLTVTGGSKINSAEALDLSKADLVMNGGQLDVNAPAYNADGEFIGFNEAGSINGGETLDITLMGSNNSIDANISGNVVAKDAAAASGLKINGTVDGTVDVTGTKFFGGVNTNKGVAFDVLSTYRGTVVTADFTAKDYKVDATIADAGWTNIGGQLAWGAHIEQTWNQNVLTINTTTINGTVSFGEGADTLAVASNGAVTANNNAVTYVDFGKGNDAIEANDVDGNKIATFGISFEENLAISGNDLVIDRNTALAAVVADVNKQFAAIFNNENMDATSYNAGSWTATLNDVAYTFTFNAGAEPYAATNVTVTVDKPVDAVTVSGSDEANILAVTADTDVDGSIALKGGNDAVIINAATLELKALKLDGFDVAYNYVAGNWVNSGVKTNVDLGTTAVLDFGTGADTLILAAAANLTAEQAAFADLTILASGLGNAVNAALKGDKLVIAGLDETDEAYDGKFGGAKDDFIVINGEIEAGEVAVSGITATFDEAVKGDINVTEATVIFNGAVDGTVTLNREIIYTAATESDPAKVEATKAADIASIKAGTKVVIENKVAEDAAQRNGEVLGAVEANKIGVITGTVEDIFDSEGNDIGDKNVSTVEVKGLAAKGTPEDQNYDALVGFQIESIENLKELVADSNITVKNIANIDKISVTGDLKITDSADFDQMEIAGTVENVAVLTGTDKADTLIIAGGVTGAIDFGAKTADEVDTLKINGITTIGGAVTFESKAAVNVGATLTLDPAASITFNGGADVYVAAGKELKGAVNFEGNMALTGAVNGTITGTGLADTLTIGGVASITNLAGVEKVAFEGFGAITADSTILNIDGATGAVDLDLNSLFDTEDDFAAMAALKGKSFKIEADHAIFGDTAWGLGAAQTFTLGDVTLTADVSYAGGVYTVTIA